MKKVILAIVMASAMSQAGTSFFKEEDKKLHMGVSYPFGMMGGLICKGDRAFNLSGWAAIACGTAIGMIPGIVKEGLDSRQPGNRWDNRDLAADAIGAFIGSVTTVTIFRFSSGKW